MLRRDYILKLIQDLFAAISNLLEGEGDELRRQRDIEALYTEFGADKDFFAQPQSLIWYRVWYVLRQRDQESLPMRLKRRVT